YSHSSLPHNADHDVFKDLQQDNCHESAEIYHSIAQVQSAKQIEVWRDYVVNEPVPALPAPLRKPAAKHRYEYEQHVQSERQHEYHQQDGHRQILTRLSGPSSRYSSK